MQRLVSFALAGALALGLAACGQTAAAPSQPQATQTPETAPAEASPAGDFYAISSTYVNSPGFNTGDVWYSLETHLGYCLITKTDYATATRQVLCSVPGCTHDSESCPAWLPGKGTTAQLFVAGDNLYVYHKVSTMHYEGSWDDYYAEVVEPKLKERPQGWEDLSDEELVTYCRGQYGESSAPAGIYCIEGDGASRRDIPASLDLTNVIMSWCDGTALYGYDMEAASKGKSVGYRLALTDGSVTTFPLQENEQIVGAQGTNLLTSRTVTPVPLPDPNTDREAYQAVLQNATVEYDWLDPATGTRTKVLERPHDGSAFGNIDFNGLLSGKLYLEDQTQQGTEDSQREAICTYDTATGQWQDLLRPIPDQSMWLPNVTVAALPDCAAQQGRYLWFSGTDNVNGENLAWVMDTRTGTLTAVKQTVQGYELPNWAVRAVALTNDGRFLVETAQQEGEYGPEYVYGLIDTEAFLQGSTDYTPVAAS